MELASAIRIRVTPSHEWTVHPYQKRGISQAGESQTRFFGFSTPNVITNWLPLIVPR
jgi:hypothetical protein